MVKTKGGARAAMLREEKVAIYRRLGAECAICGRSAIHKQRGTPNKSFQIHHVFYTDEGPHYEDYSTKARYLDALYQYIMFDSEYYPEDEFALLCMRHHFALEQLLGWQPKTYTRLAMLRNWTLRGRSGARPHRRRPRVGVSEDAPVVKSLPDVS